MIIPREFEWFGALYENDPESRRVIDEGFEKANVNDETKKELIICNQVIIPAFMNIECGIPGKAFRYMMDRFEQLDKTNPYDNGLSFKDVTDIEFESSRKGTAIQMRFVNRISDLPYRIVGFAAIENTEGEVKINKGWDMWRPV